MNDKKIKNIIIIILIPLCIDLGVIIFKDRKYNLISMIIAILSCIPIFLTFEKGETSTRRIVIIAVMIAISVAGRVAFTALQGFKPVAAIVIITAIYLGAEAGFLTGSMSAIISNIYFGQGPWTPCQMFSWGMIGFIAGLPFMQKLLLKNRVVLSIYGIFSGIIFSLIMDIWTTLSIDGIYNMKRYMAAVATSFPFMAIYAISNVVFLMLASKPFGEKLERIKIKYGI